MDWGRFTVCGSSQAEQRIHDILTQVAATVRAQFSERELRALVLIGGYGRGEGGVDRSDGHERPHNNFDLLFIARNRLAGQLSAVQRRLQTVIAPLSERYGIGMDASVTSEGQLQRARPLVLFYDMRFGHKTLVGDVDFVPSLQQFRRETIPAADVCRLLVNRGTLLLINDALLADGQADTATRRMVIRHAIKAVIGYGDALLYYCGAYHWSYLAKRALMRTCQQAGNTFRQIYDDAMAFRFAPDYERLLQTDLGRWQDELRAELEPIHRYCEGRRLRVAELAWRHYASQALQQSLFDESTQWRSWARKAANGLRSLRRQRREVPGSWWAEFGLRTAGPQSLLPIVFPAVAYENANPDFKVFAARMLSAHGTTAAPLRHAYLRAWGQHLDRNFSLSPLWTRLQLGRPEVGR